MWCNLIKHLQRCHTAAPDALWVGSRLGSCNTVTNNPEISLLLFHSSFIGSIFRTFPWSQTVNAGTFLTEALHGVMSPRLPPGLQLLLWLHFPNSRINRERGRRRRRRSCLNLWTLSSFSSSNINLLRFHNLHVSVWVIIHEGWQMADGWSRKLQHAATQRQNHRKWQ